MPRGRRIACIQAPELKFTIHLATFLSSPANLSALKPLLFYLYPGIYYIINIFNIADHLGHPQPTKFNGKKIEHKKISKNENSRILVCCEGVYSTDGDYGTLRDIIDVSKKYGAAVLVDEAHSLLVAGENGRGVCEEQDVLSEADMIIATFSKSFGGVKANVDISMSVEQGSIVGLIGPNGSGKTTLFNSIVGTYPIDKGSIKFDGTEVSELPVPVVAKLGLLRTFQQTRIYGKLNCIQNMLISHKPENDGVLTVFQKIPEQLTEKAETLLKFVGLHQKRKLRAGDLSFGQQKLLELAMALMNEPKMLLLDEPTAGINPTLINGIIDRLIKVNKEYGITLLVIEHNMKVIMNLAQRVFCLAHGQMLANGTPEEIRNDKRVLDAYLGAQ